MVQEVPGPNPAYTYNADNELTQGSYSSTRLSITYTYDKDGNQVGWQDSLGDSGSLSYDYENRMIANGACSYDYTPTGERAGDSCMSGGTYQRYDDSMSGSASNLVAQYNATGVRQTRYVSDGLDSPVKTVQGSTSYWYAVDGLGSVDRLTNASGGTDETYAYDVWGGTTASGSVSNPLRFTARSADSSGLYDYRARSYDPSANGGHRFTSADPLGGGYAYVGDSPANFVDPTGMRKIAPWGGGDGSGDAGGSSSCTLDELIGSGCPGTGTGTVSATAYTSPDNPHPVKDCTVERTIFIIGLVLSIVGLSFGSDTIRGWAGPIARGIESASNGLGMSFAVSNIIRNGFGVNSLTDILDFMNGLFFDLVLPSMGVWQGLAFAAQIVAMLNPVGLIAKLMAVVFDVASFIDLQAMGCGFG